ncbi:rhomboid-like protein [Anaeramoeba ignava]|uniref:rhomboid protease n=1 Tax=Anaeramoeba ignava TaxID=1746090 RepID=A0A9Q0LTN0_ANAIG|nr:rhomboid-like protein [Anaeramoeba ignava]
MDNENELPQKEFGDEYERWVVNQSKTQEEKEISESEVNSEKEKEKKKKKKGKKKDKKKEKKENEKMGTRKKTFTTFRTRTLPRDLEMQKQPEISDESVEEIDSEVDTDDIENNSSVKNEREPKRFPIHWFISLVSLALLITSLVKNHGFETPAYNTAFGSSIQTLLDLGAKDGEEIKDNNQWYRLVATIFLESGIITFILDASMLWWFHRQLHTINWISFILIFLITGISSAVSSLFFVPNIIFVGGSGAVFGFFGVLFVQLKQFPVGNKSSFFWWFVFVVVYAFTELLPGIDSFANLGGFITGFFCGIIFIPEITRGTRVVGVIAVLAFIGAGSAIYALYINANGWCSACKSLGCYLNKNWCEF